MTDRIKVMKGLGCCSQIGECGRCPYDQGRTEPLECIVKLAADALALLEEQEPVKPERAYSGGGITWWNVCGHCKTAINPNDKFCHECGMAVKWDD